MGQPHDISNVNIRRGDHWSPEWFVSGDDPHDISNVNIRRGDHWSPEWFVRMGRPPRHPAKATTPTLRATSHQGEAKKGSP